MDIEIAKKEFKIIIDTVRKIFKQDVKEDDEDIYEIDGRQFLAIETVFNELEKKDKELKEAQKETMQIYSDYQDIGKIAFDLDEKVQKLIEKLEEDAEKYKKENADGTLQDYIKEILSILKGEKE